jgi:hypothetical protein
MPFVVIDERQRIHAGMLATDETSSDLGIKKDLLR